MPLLTFGLIVMALAQLLDLTTFAYMIEHIGPHAEANPLIAHLVGTYGVAMPVITKSALVVLVASIAVILATPGGPRNHRRLALGILAVAIVVGIFGGWTNSLTIGAMFRGPYR
jgi:hypothetical protein